MPAIKTARTIRPIIVDYDLVAGKADRVAGVVRSIVHSADMRKPNCENNESAQKQADKPGTNAC